MDGAGIRDEYDIGLTYGGALDTQVVGAWNTADGAYVDKVGFYNLNSGYWRLDTNYDGRADLLDRACYFSHGGVGVPGRYRGGPSLLATFDQGTWIIDWDNSCSYSASVDRSFVFLDYWTGDVPVVGAFAENGYDRVGIFNDGNWYLDLNGDLSWGEGDSWFYFNPAPAGSIPVAGDFVGLGRAQAALYDPDASQLYIDANGNDAWDGPDIDQLVSVYGPSGARPFVGYFGQSARIPVSRDTIAFSSAGPISGWSCVQLLESSDPHTWDDNYLCSKTDLGLRWSSAGPIEDPSLRCTQITEPSDPDTWDDNYLCAPLSAPQFVWSSAGRVPGMYNCIQFLESADPYTWNDNYLCYN
jgi:hypothetical protein